ncbi:MAG: VCBS repeat-containing protein [Chitinophagales bacterium]
MLLLTTACNEQNEPIKATSTSNGKTQQTNTSKSLFSLLPSSHTGIEFTNKIIETPGINNLIWDGVHQGGGVAIGDINNDGLPDICLIANMGKDLLYLNKGNMQFENITQKSGLNTKVGWSGGITMADVNADGWLDIYISRYGWFEEPEDRVNRLFINNKDNTFSEKAKEYGLDNTGYTIQSTFFDYDKDGDLDLFVGNQPSQVRTTKAFQENNPPPMDANVSDRLFRNNGDNTFTDVSQKAGIVNLAYSLGVVASDLNGDGWTDIYVGNDFAKPDNMYINNQDGTFTDRLQESVKHTSNFSMGCDVADFNNDAYPDIVSLDMVAEDHFRSKTNMASMSNERFWKSVRKGYYYQYMSNSLQLNNANPRGKKGQVTFSEIGQLAQMPKTDWSWAALLADFDNDTYKDLLITNGIKRDPNNHDHLRTMVKASRKANGKLTAEDLLELSKKSPSHKIPNYLFRNNGDLSFKNVASEWGMGQPSFSNGAAYADLDLDGDLDLIINNVDDKAFVYRNESTGKNHLQLKLKGIGKNPQALNTKAIIHIGKNVQYQELTLTRGYMSACSNILHFGLGSASMVDKLEVIWSDGSVTEMQNIEANQKLELDQKDANKKGRESPNIPPPMFVDITSKTGISFKHKENEYDDFEKEILLPHKQSTNGPALAVGDVNGDGLDDFYIGGAKGQAGVLQLQNKSGKFTKKWQSEAQYEDIAALLFDADGDEYLDLYVVSGGNEFAENAPELQDRLYFNDGKGAFEVTKDKLPKMLSSGGCVAANDFDQDGDLDLFVGGRIIPAKYPFPAKSYLLQNDGGKFTDITTTHALEMEEMGLVTDAIWSDYDRDGDSDLIAVGEWMPISIFQNKDGRFTKASPDLGLENTRGWWFSIAATDIDGDGDTDYALGNLGLNSKFKVNNKKSFEVYCSDFDKSGNLDIVLVNGDKQKGLKLPVRGRECSSEQMPFIEKKFPTYEKFATASVEEIYGESLNDALHYQADELRSCILINKGNGQFQLKPLPNEAQFSTTMGILNQDLNGDGFEDLIMAGNFYGIEVETVRYDAGIGTVLMGNNTAQPTAMPISESGFFANKEVRQLAWLQLANGNKGVLVANNNDVLQLFEWKQSDGRLTANK